MQRISIISPCYNEEDNIENCYSVVRDLFLSDSTLAKYEREHIFADNASSDQSISILRRLADNDPNLKVVLNSRNFGPLRSMYNALKHATGDAILVFLPVDLQDPPDMIPEMVKHWENGIEVVAGARIEREESWALRTCRGIFYYIVNRLSDFEIPQNVGEFQLIDRKVWRAVISQEDYNPYVRGIIASVGFNRKLLPYRWKARKRGISKNNIFALIEQAMNGVFCFTNVPLRVCIFLGVIIAVPSLFYALATLLYALFVNDSAPKGAHTIIVALFFFSGVQLMFIGILGEYIIAIHAQVRKGASVGERELINIKNTSN